MYLKRPGLVLGFHGCDESLRNSVVGPEGIILKPSTNSYDWLGSGIYFWENNCQRAFEYASEVSMNPKRVNSKITKPAVLGAVIDLGHCLDLLDAEYLKLLKEGYDMLKLMHENMNLDIPQNRPIDNENDLLLRPLDCAVIETIHQFNKEVNLEQFDSVRGVFFEGRELYPNAGFREKNHIQIAVRNINCIKGFFIPRLLDENMPKP